VVRLNGYQEGHCFYCSDPISIDPATVEICDIDHFLPWSLGFGADSLIGALSGGQ
jgi:CRISPR/Cas system Type II protein with McrA/HNH and RuvC-like nuclease domain